MNVAKQTLEGVILFIAGDAPRSRRARANLASALEAAGLQGCWPREVDVLREPAAAIRYGMFATPALLRTGEDNAGTVLYGDLSNTAKLSGFIADAGRDDA